MATILKIYFELLSSLELKGQISRNLSGNLVSDGPLVSSPEHEVLMVSYCGQSMSVVRRAASTIALKAYSSYTPGPIDLIIGRKHWGDL